MLRSKIYRYFLVFFFVFSLILSGCKTVSNVNDVDENHIVTEISDTLLNDTVVEENITTDSIEIDTAEVLTNDTIVVDSVAKKDTVISKNQNIVVKKESFVDDKIERTCNDSTVQDFRNNKIYYYGQAKVVYEDITIEAEFIEFDFDKRTVFAKGLIDSTGKLYGTPIFLEGDKKYHSESMTFNFETKKGVITKVFTEDAMGYIHGTRIKKMEDNTINIKWGSYTTCSNPEHPHYGFHFGKFGVQNTFLVN